MEPTAPASRFPSRSPEHSALLEAAKTALVGGWLGIFTLPDELTFVVGRGEGARLWDVDGREYLDFLLGAGPLVLGHAHPAVVRAVQEQAAHGSHFYLLTEQAIGLARALIEAVPGAEQVRLVGSGTEATFAALRLARAFTGREKVLKFEGAFHGSHDYAQHGLAPRPKVPFPQARPESAGIPRGLREGVLVAPFNDLETTAGLIAEQAGQLAAVIVEPLQRCLPPRPGFLQGLREVCREHGVLLVLDELVTGFRLAYGGAQEYYGVEADLACYGKILGGGYPLAAIAGRAEVMALCDVRRQRQPNYAMVGGTLSGNPLAAAAGLATLAELRRDGVYARLHALGNRLRSGLEAIGERRGIPFRTVGEGPVFAPLITDVEPIDARTLARADWSRTFRFCNEMIRRGILLGRTAYLSTAHDAADIERTLAVADEVVAAL